MIDLSTPNTRRHRPREQRSLFCSSIQRASNSDMAMDATSGIDGEDTQPHEQRRKTYESDHKFGQETSLPVVDRRQMISILATAATLSGSSTESRAATYSSPNIDGDPLEQTLLGRGTWEPLTSSSNPTTDLSTIQTETATNYFPPLFVTYLTRFLIHFDSGVNRWWRDLEHSYSLLSDEERQDKLSENFGSLAQSIQQGLLSMMVNKETNEDVAIVIRDFWDLMVNRYGSQPDAMRQTSILFALLPIQYQPIKSRLQPFLSKQSINRESTLDERTESDPFLGDLSAVLPSEYHCELVADGQGIVILPTLPEQVGSKQQTMFGPLSDSPLERGFPAYSTLVYTLFGISGATGCALTHTLVIPLDVVKTRAQTNPIEISNVNEMVGAELAEGAASKGNMVSAAIEIVQNEGFDALLLGAQATIAGYFWYGLSVYPSYTFFKRILTLELLPPEVSTVHANDIALVAGALAAVIASLGLTPIEAARIRVVAEPETYRPLGLLGTLQFIAEEDVAVGWRGLYAGLPSLLARQVIFGSVKFLAFERACEFIFALWPFLRDLTWTSLSVSLVAGAFSGCLSSVVSQPADSLLTFVAQKNSCEGKAAMGLLEGCRTMIEQEGPGSLFRGLGSRSVWAGSIIAGQFLLYDVFRTFFHVSTTDLSQVYQVVVDLPTHVK